MGVSSSKHVGGLQVISALVVRSDVVEKMLRSFIDVLFDGEAAAFFELATHCFGQSQRLGEMRDQNVCAATESGNKACTDSVPILDSRQVRVLGPWSIHGR